MYFFPFIIYISSRIFDNVISKWTFCVRQFFPAKIFWTLLRIKQGEKRNDAIRNRIPDDFDKPKESR